MSLLQMSFFAGVMILVIVIVRASAINRLPKKTFLFLWGIVLARLLLPFSYPSSLSIYSLLNRHAETAPFINTAKAELFVAAPALSAGFIPARKLSIWAIAWGAGFTICAFYFILAYLRCRREFMTSRPAKNSFAVQWLREHPCRRPITIREINSITAPLTYGILRPVILMPEKTDWNDTKKLQYILAHEYVHIRHFDGGWKLMLTAALCIHWFNPLVWVMYTLVNRDIELACDEQVVRTFGEPVKSSYALLLIDLAEKSNRPAPFCSNFSKNTLEERIRAIMKIKKPTLFILLTSLLLIGGITVLFATSAFKKSNKYGVTYIAETENNSSKTAGKELTRQEILSQYSAYGISYDSDGNLLYNGEPVRYFCDGVKLEPGSWSIRYEYFNETGTADVYTKRGSIDNKDGSIDPFGDLTGLEKSSPEEFEKNSSRVHPALDSTKEAVTFAEGITSEKGITFAELFSKYEKLGITYEEELPGSGSGNVFYNGKPVKTFADITPAGGVFTYTSKDGGEITVHTLYDEKENLIGIEQDKSF